MHIMCHDAYLSEKIVLIVSLLQTLINEGMPLSVDMRNLRIYTPVRPSKSGLACCAGIFLRKYVSMRLVLF